MHMQAADIDGILHTVQEHMLTSTQEAKLARSSTPTHRAGAQSGQYEYEASYPGIDR